METKTLLILILIVSIYSLIGGAIMMALEQAYEERSATDITSTVASFLSDNSACLTSTELRTFLEEVSNAVNSGTLTLNGTTTPTQWDFGNSLFFVLTAITTIGYGNQTPQTSGGKAFIVIFALLGIPVTAVMILGVAEKMTKFTKFLASKPIPCLEKHPKVERVLKYIMIHLIMLTLLVLIPSAVFYAIENWTYGESIYYSIITFTTVGFGDYVVGGNEEGGTRVIYKLLVIVWIFLGLAWVGSVISSTTDWYKEFVDKQEKKKKDERKEKEEDNKYKKEKSEVSVTNIP